jgi:tyramine---L-glutamate ligase
LAAHEIDDRYQLQSHVKVFVCEFITGGGMATQPLPPSLRSEGERMLRALADDLIELPGTEVTVGRDPRLPRLNHPICNLTPAPGEDFMGFFGRAASNADAVWPVAPESGGALERLGRAVLRRRKLLLNSDPCAVRVCASKRRTCAALKRTRVPAVPTYHAAARVPAMPGPWVVKPDDGAGCMDVHLVPDYRAARNALSVKEPGRFVVQPWIEGDALSLSLLCAGSHASLLACNRQHLKVLDGRIVLAGITVNVLIDATGTLARIGERIAQAIPGLWGYVGVDLVIGREGPLVVEINPRLTTSYCGLKRSLGINAAALVLDLHRSARPAPIRPKHTRPTEIRLHA